MTRFPALSAARRRALLEPPSGRVRVVIDSDAKNEIDDQFALAYALLSPDRIALEAVHAAPFCYELLRPVFEAARRAAGRDTEPLRLDPPSRGMERSRDEILRVFEACGAPTEGRVFAGADRYLPDDGARGIESPAALDLIERALSRDDAPLYVVVIGCATNVASALLLEPRIVDRIVVVWDAAYPSSWQHANRSFNMEQDVPASQLLFESGVPLVYLPGHYIAEQLRLSLPEVEAWVRGRGRIGDFLADLYTTWPLLGDHFGRSWVMWDVANIAWLVNPEWLPSRLVRAPRLADDKHWQDAGEARHEMREPYALSRDAIFGDFFRKLATHAASG